MKLEHFKNLYEPHAVENSAAYMNCASISTVHNESHMLQHLNLCPCSEEEISSKTLVEVLFPPTMYFNIFYYIFLYFTPSFGLEGKLQYMNINFNPL
jgi:hypothetical protein